jgi:hypothetical protein
MSRDIVLDESRHSSRRVRPSAGLFGFVGPVVAVWVDVVGAKNFAGVLVGDGGLGVVGEDEDGFPCVVVADAEVVELAGSAEGEFAEFVDDVAADPVVNGSAARLGDSF